MKRTPEDWAAIKNDLWVCARVMFVQIPLTIGAVIYLLWGVTSSRTGLEIISFVATLELVVVIWLLDRIALQLAKRKQDG
jgi:hypothetical protein